MDFNTMLELHLGRLGRIQDRFLRTWYTEAERNAALQAERTAWIDITLQFPADERGYSFRDADGLTVAEKQKFDIYPDYPLVGLMFYRDEVIPIYDDDSGQQVFAEWNGESFSGGSYNFEYLAYFAFALDEAFDDQFLTNFDPDGE